MPFVIAVVVLAAAAAVWVAVAGGEFTSRFGLAAVVAGGLA